MKITKKLNQGILLKCAVLALCSILIVAPSCDASKKVKGGVIGATAGGALGGLIGHKAGNTVVGVLIGSAVGGATGALIGRHMDKQTEELQQDLEGATVQRVGEGILITFNDGMNFAVDSHEVPSSGTQNLNDLYNVLAKYDETDILIEGHTDDTGTDEYNMTLSEKRANSVKSYLVDKGINATRITSKAYGESQPLEDNSTDAGKKANRRVEVAIYANEDMIEAAENGDLGEPK